MARLRYLALVIMLVSLALGSCTDSSSDVCVPTGTAGDSGIFINSTDPGMHVWFFYASWCPHCHRVMSSGVLENASKYAVVSYYEVDKNETASERFNWVVNHYKIPAGVPTVLVFSDNPENGTILQGDQPIITNLMSALKGKSKQKQVSSGITKVSRDLWSDLAFLVGVAASDSINPCIMAVMLIMLATLASIKEYKRMKTFGIMYIACVYVAYLLIGVALILGSMYLINQLSMFATQVATVTKWIVAGILVFAGIVNIKDFFFWGKGITFNINEEHKRKVMEMAKKASVVAVISIAAFVTVVEFPCSGMMYLGAIFYWISQGVNPYQVFVYLLIYNAIFVLPLVFMLGIALAGKKAEEGNVGRATQILMKNKERFRLIMGIALLILAYLVITG